MKPGAAVSISVALCLLLGACAAQQVAGQTGASAQQRECFSIVAVASYSPVDRDTVQVRAGPAAYDLDLVGIRCDDINWSQSISIDNPMSSTLCVGDRSRQASITFRDSPSGALLSCRIADVRRAGD